MYPSSSDAMSPCWPIREPNAQRQMISSVRFASTLSMSARMAAGGGAGASVVVVVELGGAGDAAPLRTAATASQVQSSMVTCMRWRGGGRGEEREAEGTLSDISASVNGHSRCCVLQVPVHFTRIAFQTSAIFKTP